MSKKRIQITSWCIFILGLLFFVIGVIQLCLNTNLYFLGESHRGAGALLLVIAFALLFFLGIFRAIATKNGLPLFSLLFTLPCIVGSFLIFAFCPQTRTIKASNRSFAIVMETYEADPFRFAQALGQDVVGKGCTVFYRKANPFVVEKRFTFDHDLGDYTVEEYPNGLKIVGTKNTCYLSFTPTDFRKADSPAEIQR